MNTTDPIIQKGSSNQRTKSELALTGMAGFLSLSIFYIKNTPRMQKLLKKKNITFRLIVEAPDFPNAALIIFSNQGVIVKAASTELVADKSQWDGKMTAPAKKFLGYYTGRIGAVSTLLMFKIHVGGIFGMLNMLKLLWFVIECQHFFSKNYPLADGVFHKMYQYR
jgi:hypothetical protein